MKEASQLSDRLPETEHQKYATDQSKNNEKVVPLM